MAFNYLGHQSKIGGDEKFKLDGVYSVDRANLKKQSWSLPSDVILYAPLNDPIGTPVDECLVWTSPAGSTEAILHTGGFWNEVGSNSAIISTPGTSALGYTTCFNPGENGDASGINTNTTLGNLLFEDVCHGIAHGQTDRTSISLDYRFYLGTNSNVSGGYTRILEWSGWSYSGDGFNNEFRTGYDNYLTFSFYYGSGNSRKSYNLSGFSTNKWYHVVQQTYFSSSTYCYSALYVDSEESIAGRNPIGIDRWYTWGYSNDDWSQDHDGNGCMMLGNHAHEYSGGMNELIVRVGDPDASTKHNQDPLTNDVTNSPLIIL